ncbi:MAG: LPS export ABC transporter periplasmic protein LptC [Azospirillaceae bacterium]
MSVPGTVDSRPGTGAKGGAAGERLNRFRPGERKRANQHYSHFVTAMKVLLPTSALVLIGLVALWPLLNQREPPPPAPMTDLPERAAEAQAQILNPRFVGVDNDGRPFSVVGSVAYQSTSNTTALEIANPVAEMTIDAEMGATAQSDWAEYDREAESVSLSGAVSLARSDGFVFTTERLEIDLQRDRAWSDAAVAANGPGVDLAAAGVLVRGGGESVLFFGPASLRVVPQPDDAGAAATPPTPAQ